MSGSLTARHADNLVKIEAAGGIESLATSMRSHPTDGKLQLSAYMVLAKLAFHADNWVKIEAAGGVECIATAMRSHPTDGRLQYRACGAGVGILLPEWMQFQ